jgi:hypothetical protein
MIRFSDGRFNYLLGGGPGLQQFRSLELSKVTREKAIKLPLTQLIVPARRVLMQLHDIQTWANHDGHQ